MLGYIAQPSGSGGCAAGCLGDATGAWAFAAARLCEPPALAAALGDELDDEERFLNMCAQELRVLREPGLGNLGYVPAVWRWM